MSKLKIDKEKLLQKFKTLSVTSICIQKTAKFLYQFYKSSDLIVSIWLEALNSANADTSKISLFYIANEMLQSKNYGNTYFKQSWKPHLGHSIDCIKDSSVNDKIRRVLNIWIERKVYNQEFIDDLINRLSVQKKPVHNEEYCKNIIMNFDPEDAIDKLKELVDIEKEAYDIVAELEEAITFDEKLSKESIKKLKDKVQCHEFSEQLDNNINKLFKVCTMLEEELKTRKKTLDAMNNAEIYYETQQTETLVVEDAYRRYGNQISKTKAALEEHLDFLMDDGGPVDLDDAPSPGKTPPHYYGDKYKKGSPLSNEAVSPTQSMDMSEDDTPIDKSSYLNKPYSPSHEVLNSKSAVCEPKTSLSSTEALKLLTSVFSQSLTKTPFSDCNTTLNLQSDIFRNTLSTSFNEPPINNGDVTKNDSSKKSDTTFADAFRLISTLTGLNTVTEKPTAGTTIPTLTSRMSYNSPGNDISPPPSSSYPINNNVTGNYTHNGPLYGAVMQGAPFHPQQLLGNHLPATHNPMFSMFNDHSAPPPPIAAMFHNKFQGAKSGGPVKRSQQSPGSCTDDEDDGGATPTQDEVAPINSGLPSAAFGQSSDMGAQWCGMPPFSLMGHQGAQVRPQIPLATTTTAPAGLCGPPRAIRTRRPPSAGEERPEHSPPPPPPPDEAAVAVDELVPVSTTDNDVDSVNLYGDVEEEFERNMSAYQQSIMVRSGRPPPPPVDRYHLYNNGPPAGNDGGAFLGYQQNGPLGRPPRPPVHHPNRSQFPQRGQAAPYYFPNRTTTFRPRSNYDMFN